MARGKSRNFNPLGQTPDLDPSAGLENLLGAEMPPTDTSAPLHVLDGEAPNPSLHPNKVNTGRVRYLGNNA